MPFNFSGFPHVTTAKAGVVMDGDTFTVGSDGYTITSTLNSWTAFLTAPARSATGVWSVTLKDSAPVVMCSFVQPVLASTHYLSVQQNTDTVDSLGRLVLHWTFNSAGTPADLPADGQFRVFVVYSETSLK